MTQSSAPKILVLGAGKMGSAFLAGMLASGQFTPGQCTALVRSEPSAQALQDRLGVRAFTSWPDDGTFDVVLLAVKPAQVETAVKPLRKSEETHPLLISLVTGWSIEQLERAVQFPGNVVRAMPNTPTAIGQGVTAYTPGSGVSEEKLALVESILSAGGAVVRVEESQMHAVTALSGSGPAYVFLMIEALIEGGVREGLPRPLASRLAIEMVHGSAALLKEEGRHPALAREEVTSPGGTTIAALSELEAQGMRTAVMDAIRAAARRSAELAPS